MANKQCTKEWKDANGRRHRCVLPRDHAEEKCKCAHD